MKNEIADYLPEWIINYKMQKYNIKWEVLGDSEYALSLKFLRPVFNGNSIKIKMKNSDGDGYLINNCTFLPEKKRKQLETDGVLHSLYQTQNCKVKGHQFDTELGFHLIGNSLVIMNNHVNHINSIQIFLNNQLYLDYDKTKIELFARTYDNYIVIYFNHKNDNLYDFNGGINFSRIDKSSLNITWDSKMELDEEVILSCNTINKTLLHSKSTLFKYVIPNVICKGYWYSSFSITEVPDRSYPCFKEGFWCENLKDTTYPLPKPAETRVEQKFIDKFKKVIDSNNTQGLTALTEYLGCSTCRICKKRNGNQEYTITSDHMVFKVPSGFTHYLEEHNVHPSKEFREFIENI